VKKEYLSQLRKYIAQNNILLNEPMSKHTSFKTGGNCELMVFAKSEQDIINILKLTKKYDEKLYVLGNCTNLIVRDKGVKGTILKISKGFDSIVVEDNKIIAKAGTLLSKLAKVAQQNGLTGLEFASGIPGTVGGAVSMNAGAYGGEISDVLAYTKFIDKEGNISQINNMEHEFTYRKSVFSNNNNIIIESGFLLKKDDKSNIQKKMNDYNSRRKQKQPLQFPNAGSVFKRPLGYYTGQLIEQCNLKGYNINGAMISDLHAGFIINENNATSKDIIGLIAHIQETVYNKYKVKLETEVKIIGEI